MYALLVISKLLYFISIMSVTAFATLRCLPISYDT